MITGPLVTRYVDHLLVHHLRQVQKSRDLTRVAIIDESIPLQHYVVEAKVHHSWAVLRPLGVAYERILRVALALSFRQLLKPERVEVCEGILL